MNRTITTMTTTLSTVMSDAAAEAIQTPGKAPCPATPIGGPDLVTTACGVQVRTQSGPSSQCAPQGSSPPDR